MNVGGGASLPPFFELSAFQTIGSTNVEARRLAELGKREGQIIWSLKQETGVGRRGRHWSSPEGNLYCSVLLRPETSAVDGAKLSFLIAVALHQAISKHLPIPDELKLKWPNDLLLGGKKTAGILLESKSNASNRLDWLIVGTGINIRAFPKATDGLDATCLRDAGSDVSIETLLRDYCTHLYDLYSQWKVEGFTVIRKLWLERARGIGESVTVKLADQQFTGIFKDLDESGALVLTMPDGSTRLVTAGEVFFPGT